MVELASPKLGAALLGEPKPFYVRAAVMVTNLSVHFKLGRESSLVWVTQLNDATPVAERGRWRCATAAAPCTGRAAPTRRASRAWAKALPERDGLPSCGIDEGAREFFVTARTGDDVAFALSSWGEGIAPWRFNVPTGSWNGPYVAHAVLDRSLVRAGETVSMKLFVRQQTGGGFALPPRKALEDTLTIRHLGSEKEYEVPVKWNGAAAPPSGEATFAVPKDAYVGHLPDPREATRSRRRAKEAQERLAGTFRVEAFRVPLLRARLQAVGTPLVRPTDVAIDVQVSYLSGGGAGGLPVTLRSQVEAQARCRFPDLRRLHVRRRRREGRPRGAGRRRRALRRLHVRRSRHGRAGRGRRAAARSAAPTLPLTLDAAGGARATIRGTSRSRTSRSDLLAELEYRDPERRDADRARRASRCGPRRSCWASSPTAGSRRKEKLKFTVVAVDLAGKPVPGVRVRTDAFKRDYFSHRRRLIGGFYAYEHGYDTTRVGDLCNGVTDRAGPCSSARCAPPATGNLILRAQAADADGRAVVTRADAWVAAEDDQWFAASDNDRIDLLPEKKRYEPGDTARFQVRTPFKEATALVTIEREGVLDAFVKTMQPQRSGARRADEGQLRAERVRVGVPGARPHRRRRADRARRPRQARRSRWASPSCASAGRRTSSR